MPRLDFEESPTSAERRAFTACALAESALLEEVDGDAEALAALQRHRLRRTVRHATKNVPFYARNYDPDVLAQIKGGDDLHRLPCISKRQVQNTLDFVATNVRHRNLLGIVRTSGSTGQPLEVVKPRYVHYVSGPSTARLARRLGVPLRTGPNTVGIIRYVGFESRVGRARNPCLNGAWTYLLRPGSDVWGSPLDLLRFLDAHPGVVLNSDPASLSELAEYRMRQDPSGRFTLRPGLITTGGRPLLPSVHARLSGHFRCPIVDTYTMTEAGMIASRRPGESFYDIEAQSVILETVDERGAVTPAGEVGEICLTTLQNPWFPLIRYRTGDFGWLETRGGALPRLGGLLGRTGVLFLRRDGSRVHPPVVIRRIRDLPVLQYQLEQLSLERFVYRFVPAGGVDSTAVGRRARAAVREVFGAETIVNAEPQTALGAPGREFQPHICHLEGHREPQP